MVTFGTSLPRQLHHSNLTHFRLSDSPGYSNNAYPTFISSRRFNAPTVDTVGEKQSHFQRKWIPSALGKGASFSVQPFYAEHHRLHTTLGWFRMRHGPDRESTPVERLFAVLQFQPCYIKSSRKTAEVYTHIADVKQQTAFKKMITTLQTQR